MELARRPEHSFLRDRLRHAVVLACLALVVTGSEANAQGCEDVFAVQVVGEFNGWDALSPFMSPVDLCTWGDSLFVPATCSWIKFRTNFDWDPTPDFGRCFGVEQFCELPVPQDGSTLVQGACPGTGFGNAIGQLEFLSAGIYEFVLDLAGTAPTPTYRIRRIPGGGIRGTVLFSDDPPFVPFTTVSAFVAGTEDLAGSGFVPGPGPAFDIPALPSGLYDLRVEAFGYFPANLPNVPVEEPLLTDVGIVFLEQGCNPVSQLIQVLGEFNGWNENAPFMAPLETCVWADTLMIPAGCSYLKFRTGNSWDNPPDYGRCSGSEELCQIPVPADGSVLAADVCLVGGAGNALGQVDFPIAGFYEFILDEISGTCAIRFLGGAISVDEASWGSIKGRYRTMEIPPSR